jgi:hypothetical protein
MELDELKQLWDQTPLTHRENKDLMELIQHKSYGPVAALKKVYKKQIIMMLVLPLVLLLTNLRDINIVLTSVMFWSYVAFCIAMIVFAWYNYRLVRKMEGMDGVVKTNLEQQIDLLEKRAKLEVLVMRGVLLFFIALTEVVPYFQHYRMLAKWHALPLMVRVSAYAGLLMLQYFLNRRIKKIKVGRHLMYLKEVVKELR